MERNEKKCPYCGHAIKATAIKCRFCGHWLDRITEPPINPTNISTEQDKASSGNTFEIIHHEQAEQAESFLQKITINYEGWIYYINCMIGIGLLIMLGNDYPVSHAHNAVQQLLIMSGVIPDFIGHLLYILGCFYVLINAYVRLKGAARILTLISIVFFCSSQLIDMLSAGSFIGELLAIIAMFLLLADGIVLVSNQENKAKVLGSFFIVSPFLTIVPVAILTDGEIGDESMMNVDFWVSLAELLWWCLVSIVAIKEINN